MVEVPTVTAGYEEELIRSWEREELIYRYAEVLLEGAKPKVAPAPVDPALERARLAFEKKKWEVDQQRREEEKQRREAEREERRLQKKSMRKWQNRTGRKETKT